MKQIFFGWVNLKEFSNVEREDLFYHKGNYYWYKLGLEEEQICLYDTCGRMVPLGHDVVSEFTEVMNIINLNQLGHKEVDEEMKNSVKVFYNTYSSK